jgi:hypothetical protein
MLDNTQIPPILGVQFLSREFEPQHLEGMRYRSIRFASGEVLDLTVDLEILGGLSPFTFAQPWPQFPSIGAFEYVDPYVNTRWPSRLILTSRGTCDRTAKLPAAFIRDLLCGIRIILMEPIRSSQPFLESPDQLLQTVGYRRIYHSTMLDFVGNPHPSDQWFLSPAEAGEPLGPGFAKIDGVSDDLNQQALVWSQAVSFPSRKTIQIDESAVRNRIQELKQHWNSQQEIADATTHLERVDEKAAIRSAAAAVEAAAKFYCSLWKVEFPRDQSTFDDKIESVLSLAGRPSFRGVNPSGSQSLLRLYRARSSMHEGDCYYKDPQTGQRVDVRIFEARQLVADAQRFLLWMDSQA